MIRKKGKIFFIAICVLLVVIISVLIMNTTRRDCPLTDVKLGMTYDKTISLLDKRGKDYEVLEINDSHKLICVGQSMQGIEGEMIYRVKLVDHDYNVVQIGWSPTTVDTEAEYKDNVDKIKNYLLRLYGSDYNEYKTMGDALQGCSW